MNQSGFQRPVIKKIVLAWILALTLMVCYPFYENMGIYVGIGIFLSVFLLLNMGMLLSEQVAIPHLMTFNYFFQLFFASLVLYFYPPAAPYDIGRYRYPDYLSYIVPACTALYLGVILAIRKLKPLYFDLHKVRNDVPAWARYSKHLFYVGVFFYVSSRFLSDFSTLGFLFVLISSLRYVGFFALILLGYRKWWIYGVIILVLDLLSSVSQGMFGALILWGASFFLIIAYRYKWKARAVLALILSMIFLTILQSAKTEYRKTAWQSDVSVTSKFSALWDSVSGRIEAPSSVFDANDIESTFVRFNQGWIVNRVLEWVPAMESYAYGRTIIEGLYAAFVPRVIARDKPVAGGVKYMDKYAGLELRNTSMNIGIVGEMYANFGTYGGVLAMGVFGYLIGFLYSMLYKKASQNAVWWAWGPFVGLWAMKGEEGFMDVTTWIVKSILVMVVVVYWAERMGRRRRAAKRRVRLRL